MPSTDRGSVLIPLIDLQTLILNLGEAERRAHGATNGFSTQQTEIQRLTASLTSSESELSAARSELEKQRQRVRDLETSGIGGPPQKAEGGAENERLRERVVGLETVITQARSEINGQRRRIRELEARPPSPSPKALATADENERLREQLNRLQDHLATAKSELDNQRRRIRDLETLQRASSEMSRAAEAAELQQLRRQVTMLEARMAESRSEADHQRRKIRELEAFQPASQESAPVVEEVPDQVVTLEVELSEAREELDRQRSKIRELEAYIFESSALTPPEPGHVPLRPTRHPVAAPPAAAGPYDDEQQPAWPPPPVVPSRHPVLRRENRETGTSQRPGERHTGAVSRPASAPAPDPTVTRLRHLYRRLQEHSKDEALSPDDQRRWIADLAAYDMALVLACIELGVPTTFRPGNRLPADDRVALTRALSAVGLDVAS